VTYRLRTSRRAGRHIREAAAWWQANRDKAPLAFAEDLSDALRLVSELPRAGEPVRHAGMPNVRRVLLARTGYHLYYIVDEAAATIELLVLWHTRRGMKPEL
jgi:plasmid stabilization system protein ParE